MAPLGHQIAVGAAQRAQQLAVAHGPAVHEQELVGGVVAVARGKAREARQEVALALGLDGHAVGGELLA